MLSSARWSARPGTSCTAWCSVPPKRHIHFLCATANGQQWHATRQHTRDQRQHPGVTFGVKRQGWGCAHLRQSARGARWRATPSASTPWAPSSAPSISSGSRRGTTSGKCAGQTHRLYILAASDVEGVFPQHAVAGGHQDKGFGGVGGGHVGSPEHIAQGGTTPWPAPGRACAAGRRPGKARCFQTCEDIKSRRVARHGLGHKAPRHAGQ
jgi:hypothetical protein